MKNTPWSNSTKWKRGYWYPEASSHDICYLNKESTVVEALWGLYKLDEEQFNPGQEWRKGDIVPFGVELNFIQAVKLANKLNPEKLFTFPWAKELE